MSENRTVGFKPGKTFDLTSEEKALLSWSLGEHNNGRPGVLTLQGKTIRTKHQQVKQVLLDYVILGEKVGKVG